MAPGTVLKQYLELCSHDIGRLSYQLASNAALEWNGITVRGASKIVKFLRQKQHAGMVQSFPNVSPVDAFEQRETHIATKSIPPENLIKAASPSRAEQNASPQLGSSSTSAGGGNLGSNAGDLSFETPPRTLPAVPHPPPLTGGRQFLPLSSDEEEDDDANPSSTKRTPTPPPDEEPRQNIYSELQYLEAIGTLRTANEPKHRGTRTTHHIPREDPSADSSGGSSVTHTGTGGDYSEKRTKLKVSYRTHLLSREVQFALIIYEHISSRSNTVRRNLFVEELHHQSVDSDEESSFSPIQRRLAASPELTPLPESPPTAPPPSSSVTELESPPRTPVQPPGTPIKRRRIPPLIAGMRTSPRRSRPVDDFAIITGASSSNGGSSSGVTTFTIQQTWPRKNQSAAAGGGSPGSSAAKSRKLASGSTSTIRKPLRF